MDDGFFRTLAELSPDALLVVEPGGTITYANGRCRELLGYDPGELAGLGVDRLVPPRFTRHAEHRAAFQASPAVRAMAGGLALEARSASGEDLPVDIALSPLPGDRVLVALRDARQRLASELQLRQTEARLARAEAELAERRAEIDRLHAELEEQAVRDPLTGLLNQRHLDDVLPRELARSARSGVPVSVVTLELDRFEQLGAEAGHAASDDVLRRVAEVLRTRTRRSDTSYRIGSGAFLVLMPGATALQAARRAEEWRAAFGESLLHATKDIRQVHCTLSVGVADAQRDDAPQALLERADQALAAAKQAG